MSSNSAISFIAVQGYTMRPSVGRHHFLHHVESAVGRTIVGKDDFQRCIRLGKRTQNGILDELLLVVGNHAQS